jgi:putative membrane protein
MFDTMACRLGRERQAPRCPVVGNPDPLEHTHDGRTATRCKVSAREDVANQEHTEVVHRMLWLKAFHVVAVVMWFAGLFYLPRLFVYHVVTTDAPGIERFQVMERRLFVMMTIGAAMSAFFGISMLIAAPGFLSLGWIHAKLTLVAALIGYHVWCHRLMLGLRNGTNVHSQRWFRMFNEVPSLLLIAIVVLAVVKPF